MGRGKVFLLRVAYTTLYIFINVSCLLLYFFIIAALIGIFTASLLNFTISHLLPVFYHSILYTVRKIHLQFSSVAQSSPTLRDPMNRSTPGFPVHHQLREFTQTHVHWVRDAIQPSHPLLPPFPPAPNPSQHQSLFQWVNSSHEVAKVLEFQL